MKAKSTHNWSYLNRLTYQQKSNPLKQKVNWYFLHISWESTTVVLCAGMVESSRDERTQCIDHLIALCLAQQGAGCHWQHKRWWPITTEGTWRLWPITSEDIWHRPIMRRKTWQMLQHNATMMMSLQSNQSQLGSKIILTANIQLANSQLRHSSPCDNAILCSITAHLL